jgi:hypothetical protein
MTRDKRDSRLNRNLYWLLGLAAVAMAILAVADTRQAHGLDATVVVNPASQNVSIGQQFTTQILINDVTSLQGADIDISYNDAVLDFVSYTQSTTVLPTDFSPSPVCASGSCNYAAARIGASFNGSGLLFTITWQAQANGTSNIDILDSSAFSDGNGQPIVVVLTDGSVTVSSGSPTPTATATPTATPTATATPTPTTTATPTGTGTASPTPTGTPAPTPTGTATPTPTGNVTPTPTGNVTPTPTGTGTPTGSPTPTPTGTGSPTPTATATPAPTGSPTPTPTPTLTPTPSATATATPTATPTTTPTPTPGGLPIEQQLGDCLPFTNVVWGHDNQDKIWFGYDPGVPDVLQTLTQFEEGEGYVINLSAPCTLNVNGTQIQMYAGWNLFGWD